MACGAWIETGLRLHRPPVPGSPRMACGAWIETYFVRFSYKNSMGSPRMACGAWIETCIPDPHARTFWVRPAWRAGRGLKRGTVLCFCRFDLCSPRMACGAWIETDRAADQGWERSVRPAWRAGRGLK